MLNEKQIKQNNIKKIKEDLGENYNEDYSYVLENLYDEISSIASDISGRLETDIRLFPYIKRAVKAEYLRRGAEGQTSSSEGSISSSFEDTIENMRNNIVKNGLRRLR